VAVGLSSSTSHLTAPTHETAAFHTTQTSMQGPEVTIINGSGARISDQSCVPTNTANSASAFALLAFAFPSPLARSLVLPRLAHENILPEPISLLLSHSLCQIRSNHALRRHGVQRRRQRCFPDAQSRRYGYRYDGQLGGADVVHHLRRQRFGGVVELPQLVVCGESGEGCEEEV
jgi:hypothetical protein